MTTFTQVYDAIEDDISTSWYPIPMRQRDIKQWSDKHTKFVVTIEYNGNKLETSYYTPQGYVIDMAFLSCLVADARAAHEQSFVDFCNNYGYDTDSIKALNIYKSCKKQHKKLCNLLGEDLFNQFMECDIDV